MRVKGPYALSEQCTCSFIRNSVYRHILQYPLILLSGQLKPLIESANAQAGQAFDVRMRAFCRVTHHMYLHIKQVAAGADYMLSVLLSFSEKIRPQMSCISSARTDIKY